MQTYCGEYGSPEAELYVKEYVHEINRFRFNWHDFLELIVVVNGRMEAYVGGQRHCLEEDDVLLINSNVGHATLLRQVGTKAIVVHISPAIFRGRIEGYETFRFNCVSTARTRYSAPFCGLRRFAALLLRELVTPDAASGLYIEALARLLAVHLLRGFPLERIYHTGNPKNSIPQKTLDEIMAYTEKHYQKKISLGDIASLTQYNPAYISSFFKSNVGINYYEYLQRVRLRHAIQALNKTARSITEIAMDTGFADAKSFSNTFKRYFVITPAQYRESIKHDVTPVIDEMVRVYVAMPDQQVEEKLGEWSRGEIPQSEPGENRDEQAAARAQTAARLRALSEELETLAGSL